MIIESEQSQGINPESWTPHENETTENVDPHHDCTFLISKMINRIKRV